MRKHANKMQLQRGKERYEAMRAVMSRMYDMLCSGAETAAVAHIYQNPDQYPATSQGAFQIRHEGVIYNVKVTRANDQPS